MAPPPSVPLRQNAFAALASSRQLLRVIAPNWDSCAARLQRFEWQGLAGGWHAVGESLTVSLGRSGLAWGRGLHPPIGGLQKCEGDGRAPAGIFAITALFGYPSPASPFARAAKLPYLHATPDLKAVDDPASAYYNRIVDQSTLAQPDWISCEDMLRDDLRYAVGAVVAHNSGPAQPGVGSCIFLHVWAHEAAPTAGCTAMSLAAMTDIASWLDAAAAPLLVQLPLAEYDRLAEAWGLPVLPA